MALGSPIRREWLEDAMACSIDDPSTGIDPIRLVLLGLLAGLLFSFGMVAANAVVVMVAVLVGPAVLTLAIYVPDALFRQKGTHTTELVLRQDSVEIRTPRSTGSGQVIPMGRIRSVTGRVHPTVALVFELASGSIEVRAGLHDPGEVDDLAAEIQRAVDRHRLFLDDQREAASEHAPALRKLVERVDE